PGRAPIGGALVEDLSEGYRICVRRSPTLVVEHDVDHIAAGRYGPCVTKVPVRETWIVGQSYFRTGGRLAIAYLRLVAAAARRDIRCDVRSQRVAGLVRTSGGCRREYHKQYV